MANRRTPRSEIRRSPLGDRAFAEAAQELGERLRRLRKRELMTQEVAAERIGIHPVTLREIEHGRMNLTLATMCAIALAYDVEMHNLFPRPRSRQ